MKKFSDKLFICVSAKDRYVIAQPIVYHLKNYGINVWYDRYEMIMGDDRFKKNIEEGAGKSKYAIIILSHNTITSFCAREEIQTLKLRYFKGEVTVFPVLYELKPSDIPPVFAWIKKLIFKEADRSTGTLEICNHIVCKITCDMLNNCKYKNINEIIQSKLPLPRSIRHLFENYIRVDNSNLNSKITLLYAIYIIITESNDPALRQICKVPCKIFDRLFTENLLNLLIDYRELWLLENSICILIECYYGSCTEFKI